MMTPWFSRDYAYGSNGRQISRWLGKRAMAARPLRWHKRFIPMSCSWIFPCPRETGSQPLPHCAHRLLSLHDDATLQAQAHAVGAVTLVGKQEGGRRSWERYAKPESSLLMKVIPEEQRSGRSL